MLVARPTTYHFTGLGLRPQRSWTMYRLRASARTKRLGFGLATLKNLGCCRVLQRYVADLLAVATVVVYVAPMTKALVHKDFRLFLQQELIRRCDGNPAYSLRAFARHLRVDAATLSSLLAQKRKVTPKTVRKLGSALSLTPAQIDSFVTPLQPYLAELSSTQTYQQITHDTFVAISDWYHDAILELTRVRDFKPEGRWIAKVLGISASEVNAAVDRLQRLELLEIKNGKWVDASRFNSNTLDANFSSAAMRKYQKVILEKSIHALETLPRTERDHTSLMVVGNQKSLQKVKALIAKFRRQLADLLQSEKPADEVYQISISLFPISKVKQQRFAK